MAILRQVEGFNLASRGSKCSICGTGAQQNGYPTQVISTGIVIDFEGSFDICFSCARDIGTCAEMIDRAAYDDLEMSYRDAIRQLTTNELALVNKEDAIRLLSGELVGASARGVYGNIAIREVDTEPDFGGEA